ncbi:uncharacterized protein [Miscanthus floridulus]|uniref:uncharacterized protein n=1 Tax=Miscanthus floridulus TaxID=154761 RepID=UPI003459F9BC
MAAEMVSSALAQEAVNEVLSRIKEGYAEKSDAKEHIERMEMAHIKLEAALETSHKWNISSAPLLRWQSKLKRASQECDHTLRRCRQRFQEEEEVQQAVQSSSFPKRVAHTARSLVPSIFSRSDDDKLTRSTAVLRFERFEFLGYVELGGTPRRYMFFDPLIRHLLAGKGTKHCFVSRGQHLSFVLQPFSPPEHGMEGCLTLLLEDTNASENNFLLALSLRLSESTDVVGVAIRCLHLFTPYLSSTAETVKTKLTQQQDHDYTQRYNATSSSSKSLPCDIRLEPVIQVYLLGHVTLSVGNNRQRAVVDGESETNPIGDCPYLKLGARFWPHASFEDLSPGIDSSATEIINGVAAQRDMYAKISFEQLTDIMIPKAVDCLRRDVAATSYQILWKSKHGGSYIQVEKTSWRGTTQKVRQRKQPNRWPGKKVQGWASVNNEFICSWIRHASTQLKDSVVDWIQKERRLPLPVLLKTNSCFRDCPIMLLSLQDHRSLVRTIKSHRTFSG